jgi:hypothetical protein
VANAYPVCGRPVGRWAEEDHRGPSLTWTAMHKVSLRIYAPGNEPTAAQESWDRMQNFLAVEFPFFSP